MSNIENDDDNNVTFIGRTQQNENDNSTSLIIPLESVLRNWILKILRCQYPYYMIMKVINIS